MADDLAFPRIIYRGVPDTLGGGTFSHPETGELVGETRRCESQSDLDAALKDGWRLTRELSDEAAAADAGAGAKPAKAKR